MSVGSATDGILLETRLAFELLIAARNLDLEFLLWERDDPRQGGLSFSEFFIAGGKDKKKKKRREAQKPAL